MVYNKNIISISLFYIDVTYKRSNCCHIMKGEISMLISIIWYLKNFAAPAFLEIILNGVMPVIIIMMGIAMLLSIVGINFRGSISTAVVNNIFNAIGYVCRGLLRGLWRLARAIWRLIPRLFFGVRSMCSQRGMSPSSSNAVATIVIILFVAIII